MASVSITDSELFPSKMPFKLCTPNTQPHVGLALAMLTWGPAGSLNSVPTLSLMVTRAHCARKGPEGCLVHPLGYLNPLPCHCPQPVLPWPLLTGTVLRSPIHLETSLSIHVNSDCRKDFFSLRPHLSPCFFFPLVFREGQISF